MSTPDFRRDARSIIATTERLQILHAKKLKIEDELMIHFPSIRNGDSLFQEFETLNFERPGYERYEKVLGEIRQLSSRLHENTKFEKLTKYGSANLSTSWLIPMSWHPMKCLVDGDGCVLLMILWTSLSNPSGMRWKMISVLNFFTGFQWLRRER